MSARHSRLILIAAVLCVAQAKAAVITYQATHVSDSTWRYDYTVSNDGAITSEIRLFDILFDPAFYSELSLSIVSDAALAPAWNQVILASGIGVPAAFDALATGIGIGNGQAVSGFAVTFTWLGTNPPGPGAQNFEIYSPSTFALLGTGTTSAVPAPAALWLLGTGLLAAGLRARRRRSALNLARPQVPIPRDAAPKAM